jgi:hypothetical protein
VLRVLNGLFPSLAEAGARRELRRVGPLLGKGSAGTR